MRLPNTIFFRVVFLILDPFHFHTNFRDSLSISTGEKKATWLQIGTRGIIGQCEEKRCPNEDRHDLPPSSFRPPSISLHSVLRVSVYGMLLVTSALKSNGYLD